MRINDLQASEEGGGMQPDMSESSASSSMWYTESTSLYSAVSGIDEAPNAVKSVASTPARSRATPFRPVLGTTAIIAKYLLITVNVILFICGQVISFSGRILYVNLSGYVAFAGNSFWILNALLVLGILISCLAVLGCYAACTDTALLLATYALSMLCLLAVELWISISICSKLNDTVLMVRHSLQKRFTDYKEYCNDTRQDVDHGIPESCCKDEAPNCVKDCKQCLWVNGNGTYCHCRIKLLNNIIDGYADYILDFIERNCAIACWVAAGFIAFQFTIIIVSLCLVGAIKRGWYKPRRRA